MGQNDCVGHLAPEKRALELAAFKPANRTAQNAAPFAATADRSVKPAYDEKPQGEDVDRLQKASKWVERRREAGVEGLSDRSSRPRRLRRPTPQAKIDDIIALRRQRFTGKHIAKVAGVSAATVSRVLKRAGLSRMRDLEPAEPVKRYERQNPGEMIHIDIKKLGRFERVGHRITGDRTGQSNSRGVGWEFVHVCVDDASRIAFTQIKPDEKAVSAVDFLKAAIAYYKSLGVTVARVMTDNGSCYKSHAFAKACKRLRSQAHPHETLHAQDQRQGRALHPDRPARMGLRNSLSRHQTNAPTSCPSGCTDTTGIVPMAG